MKRKTYQAQTCHGASAIAHTFNAAIRAGERLMREYAEAHGLIGTWRKESGGIEKDEHGTAVHGWRVYRHDRTGEGLRFVVNLQT